MDAAALVAEVERLGGQIRVCDGRLQVKAPQGGLPEAIRAAVRDHKIAIINFLTQPRLLSPEEVERHELLTDPRQRDFPEDTLQWQLMFWHRHEAAGPNDDLLHILRTLRWAGARIECTSAGARILPGDELGDEYETLRTEWLKPHESVLRELLQEIRSDADIFRSRTGTRT